MPERRSEGPTARGSDGLRGLASLALTGWLALVCMGSGVSTPATPAQPPAAGDALGHIDVAAQDNARVTLSVLSDLSPYDSVRYEVKRRGTTVIASLSKQLADGFDELGDVALLPLDEMTTVVEGLRACGIEDLAPDAPDDPLLTYQLEIELGTYHRVVRFAGRATLPGTPQWCVARLIMDTYFAFGDPVPFENRFWNEGNFGQLQVDSTPAARLIIDGRDTGLTTPVWGYRLEPGRHELRFVNDGLGIDRTYDVTVEIGLTTRLEVELR